MTGRKRSSSRSHAQGKRVIIVGAGLAGLSCAYELSKHGYHVDVLEANSRPGGRVQTLRKEFSRPLFAEAGPYWVNEAHTVAMRYFRELGIEGALSEIPLQDNYLLCHIMGSRIESHLRPNEPWPSSLNLDPLELKYGLGRFTSTIFSDPGVGNPAAYRWPPVGVIQKYGQMTFKEFLSQEHPTPDGPHTPSAGMTELIRLWFAWWDDPMKLSALAMIQYGVIGQRMCDDPMARHKWFVSKKGMDLLPRSFEKTIINIAKDNAKAISTKQGDKPLPFTYNARVTGLRQDQQSVTATYMLPSGDENELSGDYLVCAVPFSTLREFKSLPEFSDVKKEAINKLKYASVARAYLQCKKSFSDLADGAGFTDLPIGNLLDMGFVQGENRGKLLQAFMTGEHAKDLADKEENDRRAFVLEHMQTVFRELKEKDVERWAFKFWDRSDPYARGAYPLFTPEQFLRIRDIASPEGRIHFAGEHTSEYTAWMEGALRSGIRAAGEIFQR
jgi:monoamine oxidase